KKLWPANRCALSPENTKEHMMKRIILASLIALTTVGAANAFTDKTTLSVPAKMEAEHILPGVSFDNLTARQATIIEGLLTTDTDMQDYEVKQAIEVALSR
ncbi:hypothetical protein ACEN2J_16115, partial [Pseudorhodobacter sp. W20_MBD10_FR17]|uniref:hypothetical protein n=1 Tax=Pseudorhodobacter sp. W20_MBD10_FR17 TaxID=3240266 RepID=UPI003F9E37B1